MNITFASECFATCRKLLCRFWRAEVGERRCTSITGRNALELDGEFLASAECLELDLSIRWPWLARRTECPVELRLVPEPAARLAAMHPSIPYQLKQSSSRRFTQLRIRISGPVPPICESLDLELIEVLTQRPFAHLKIRVLDDAAVEDRLLKNLRARDSRLWVQNRTGCRPAQAVSAKGGFLVAEFVVPPSDWSAFIGPIETTLKLELVSPLDRIEVERIPIILKGEPLTFRSNRLALADRNLFPQPGRYSVIATIGGKLIAILPFELIAEAEVLRRVKVPQIHITAQTRTGESEPGLTTLRWEEHRAVLASLQIRTEVSAPDILVNCTASISEGDMVLRNEDIVFPLDRVSRTINLKPLEFGLAGLRTQPKPARLTIAVKVGGEEKASTMVLVLPPERITNFEGQLSFDVKDLPFDEVEYNQIVQRLRICDDSTPHRGFWGWVASKILRE